MEKLSVINRTRQKQKGNNNNEHLAIIEYPCLIELNFLNVHNDYVEQFLVNINTCLPNNIYF